jgi:hypothetical protein
MALFPNIFSGGFPGGGGGGGASEADQVSYDNTTSGLSAQNVQAMGDELASLLSGQADLISNLPGAVSPRTVTIGASGSHTISNGNASLAVENGAFVSTVNIVRNNTPANPVTITFPIANTITKAGQTFVFKVSEDQTGTVSFVPAQGGTIEGLAFDAATPTRAVGPGSLVTIVVLRNDGDAPEMSAEGEIVGQVIKRVIHPGSGGWAPRASNGATIAVLQGSEGELSNRGFAFSQTTSQAIDRIVRLPTDFPATSSVRVSFLFNTTNTSGNNVVWNIQRRRMNLTLDWDTTAHTYTTGQKVATVAAPTVAGRHSLVSVTFSSSELDGAVAGEAINFRIERAANTDVNAAVIVPEHTILIEEV